jgi:hypothetical protein
MFLVANQAEWNQVDRGADNPDRNIITKPVREAKVRLWSVVPLTMMMMMMRNTHYIVSCTLNY